MHAIYDESLTYNSFTGMLIGSLTDSAVNNSFISGKFMLAISGEQGTSFAYLIGLINDSTIINIQATG